MLARPLDIIGGVHALLFWHDGEGPPSAGEGVHLFSGLLLRGRVPLLVGVTQCPERRWCLPRAPMPAPMPW